MNSGHIAKNVNDVEARIIRLEERYTHLQNHVSEQDRVILELREEIDRLRQEVGAIRGGARASTAADEMPADERPPHY